RGQMAVDDEAVAPEGLRPLLARRLAEPGNREVLVVVRADSQVPFTTIRHTLDDARAAGARRLAIATRQRAEARRWRGAGSISIWAARISTRSAAARAGP